MVHKALMLTGLKKQYALLGELLENMENKPAADMSDQAFYYGRTRMIAANLRRLRRIRRTYGVYVHPAATSDNNDYFKESLKILADH